MLHRTKDERSCARVLLQVMAFRAEEGSSETRWLRSQCCAMLHGRAQVAPESAEHLLRSNRACQ